MKDMRFCITFEIPLEILFQNFKIEKKFLKKKNSHKINTRELAIFFFSR